nr:hypothetical protein [Candidatus Sigynarchaeum springense]MDO8118884.1 hypothetical protein [Candidatus Sigynarchaeota archaeon]
MSNDQEKNKPKFALTPPPPPPPSIEEITRGMKGRPPPEPPAVQVVPQATMPQAALLQGAYTSDAAAAMLQQENYQLLQALEQARQAIAARDAEIATFNSSYKEIQVQLVEVAEIIKAKDTELGVLRARVETLTTESKNMGDEAARWKAKYDLVEETVSRYKQDVMVSQRKAEGYQKETEKVNEALKAANAEKAELQNKLEEAKKELQQKLEDASKESQAKIEEVKKQAKAEIDAQQAETAKIKDLLSKYEAGVKEQEKKSLAIQDEMATLKDKLVNEVETRKAIESKLSLTAMRLILGNDAIISLFNELIAKAIHSIMFVVPTIKELQQLDLAKLKPSVKATAAVKFDVASRDDVRIVEEIQKKNRIEIRAFSLDDRWGINVDRGTVFIGVNSKTEPFGLITDNPEAIDLFMRQFIVEAWTRGRPINVKP